MAIVQSVRVKERASERLPRRWYVVIVQSVTGQMQRLRYDARTSRETGSRRHATAAAVLAMAAAGRPASRRAASTAAERGAHLLAEVRAAQAVQEEVDDVVGGGDHVGDLPRHPVRQRLGRSPRRVGVLGVLEQGVGDGVGEAEADERHADGDEHQRELALGRPAWSRLVGDRSGRPQVRRAIDDLDALVRRRERRQRRQVLRSLRLRNTVRHNAAFAARFIYTIINFLWKSQSE